MEKRRIVSTPVHRIRKPCVFCARRGRGTRVDLDGGASHPGGSTFYYCYRCKK
jgi:hypothetical protein